MIHHVSGAYMSQKHPDFSTLAARIAVSNLHKTLVFPGTVDGLRWCQGGPGCISWNNDTLWERSFPV